MTGRLLLLSLLCPSCTWLTLRRDLSSQDYTFLIDFLRLTLPLPSCCISFARVVWPHSSLPSVGECTRGIVIPRVAQPPKVSTQRQRFQKCLAHSFSLGAGPADPFHKCSLLPRKPPSRLCLPCAFIHRFTVCPEPHSLLNFVRPFFFMCPFCHSLLSCFMFCTFILGFCFYLYVLPSSQHFILLP